MHWMIAALVASLCYAVVTHIDKYLLSSFFQGRTTGALLLFSAFIGIPVLLVISTISPNVYAIGGFYAAVLTLNGFLYVTSLLPYFYALDRAETSQVGPLFQIVSIFSALLGYTMLGETLTLMQIIGCGLIVLGGVLLSIDRSDNQPTRVKFDVLLLMTLSSFIMALNGFLFKFVAIHESFLTSLFWEYFGFCIFALIVFFFVPSYRREFVSVLRKNKASILGLNVTSELLSVTGKIMMHVATLLSPLAFAYVIHEAAQPVFTLLLGIVLTVFFPKISKEDITTRGLFRKSTAIISMVIGTIFIQ